MKKSFKKTTVYFDLKLFRALQIKAVETKSSVSTIASRAIRQYLNEDTTDLTAFHERATERGISFEQVVKKLKRAGKI
jgi:predicted transcriptional regulator